MAYSSIGHMGYALVGLAAGNPAGISGVVIYMAIYMVMTLGGFAVILSMRGKDGAALEKIDDLAGLSSTNPLMATVLTALMFSLAGIPPLAGFFGKWFVFVAAVEAKLYALAIIGVLSSVVGAYYYLRVVKVMWFDAATNELARVPGSLKLVFSLSGLFVIGYVLFGGMLGTAAETAAAALF
jgi:NADH-quinone oxidoreductase subunit N